MMRRRNASGFTLTELMVGIVVAGIVIAVAVPNLRSYRESLRVATASQRVAGLCKAAQARARSEAHHIFVEYRTDENALAVVDDENNNGVADSGETVTVHPLGDGLQLSSTTFANDQLVFDSHGRAVAGGDVVIAGPEGVTPRQLRIATGTGAFKLQACDRETP